MAHSDASWQGWPAPAKLNLFLHVTGRRADGYHLLQTVFQFLDYGDTLDFLPRDDGVICRVPEIAGLPQPQDLVVRAAQQLRAVAGLTDGVTIRLAKRLPVGGGLGGGSSDAATVLCALNQLWRAGLSDAQLAQLGLALGADVPVFIHGQAAWAEGVGEMLQPIDIPERWYLVVVPPCQVPTREIFAAPELTRDCKPVKIDGFLSGKCRNVCEPVVFARYPLVRLAHDWLAQQAGHAYMSGTGASVFAIFDDRTQAEALRRMVPDGWAGFVARGCNRSPLQQRRTRGE
ncbi:MAG: 4-(cytidine 5'-diphospho)-2-C-methyl-D-erythritol kinase [Gammaproteobacteria bacterium]|nr:4-(cytidine 5'-diphospho)-2-C-methyl-D-erythritol kinase [Gammaproteobacteria bacterium]